MNNINTELKEILLRKGASIVGFADLKEIDPAVRDNMPFGISVAIAVDPDVIKEIKDGPTKRYWDEYNRLNSILKDLAATTVDLIRGKGHQAKWVTGKLQINCRLPY